ncbi:hypothetical protein [Priestia megaterium]|uniref:Uncharacterized protein n=1 Tax=Priestia megaterium TaxID=1404 RepID=A0A6M6DZZ1_PRIMG|nr:hypothetical protein [Priestia megaterium]QJX80431.1 hypothetical protein FDZ14_30555 [Priestia megaterium]
MKLMRNYLKNKEEIAISYFDALEIPTHFKLVTESPESIHIDGFTYLSTLDIGQQGESEGYQFVVASQGTEIVGALLFARLDENQEVCKQGGSLNLFYVDVRIDKWNQGIAKQLFVGWAKYLEVLGDKKEIIQLNFETILGMQANIHSVAEKALQNHIISYPN